MADLEGGPLAGLIGALALLAGGAAEYLRRRMRNGHPPKLSQLDRIEAALATLTRTLVADTEEGGKIPVGRKLAENLSKEIGARLDSLETAVKRRQQIRAGEVDGLSKLTKNVESLSEAVQSALDLMRELIRERER